MLTNILFPIRALLLVAALAFSMPFALAQDNAEPPRSVATARTLRDTAPASRDDTSLGGVLIILGIVGSLILLAWIASRIGDNRTDTVVP